MIKGWKNDPRWVVIKSQLKAQHEARVAYKKQLEHEQQMQTLESVRPTNKGH